MRSAVAPPEVLSRLPASGDLAVVRDGPATVVAVGPDRVIRAGGQDALATLDRLPPGWWAGFLAYDLGRAVERVPDLARDDLGLPDLLLARFPNRIVYEPDGAVRTVGDDITPSLTGVMRDPTALASWTSSLDRGRWDDAVARIHAHLRAGDCYQVNLTRRLATDAAADPVALFSALLEGNPAPHSALVRIGDDAVISASPECFLRRDGRTITTRPIKGTARDAQTLRTSEKDRAENVMIVDLARNDLGRVCEYGTIHVPELFEIEEHPGLYHLVSTVTGTLRETVSIGDIVRATYPPASVTGCPKPRVLEIIEHLEPVRRGVYCGAIGFIDTEAEVMDLNVAIRTFTITGGRTYFGVGGGIVADSDAATEWDETELKAAHLLALAGGETSRNRS